MAALVHRAIRRGAAALSAGCRPHAGASGAVGGRVHGAGFDRGGACAHRPRSEPALRTDGDDAQWTRVRQAVRLLSAAAQHQRPFRRAQARSCCCPLAVRAADPCRSRASSTRRQAITIRQPASEGPARPRESNLRALQVGFMGTLMRHKGVLTLLEAFRSAPAGWRLHLAGGGVLDDAVSAACATDERITHHGYVTWRDEERLLRPARRAGDPK